MATIYVYKGGSRGKGGSSGVTPENILGSTGLVLNAMIPNAWYAQCGCEFAVPLTPDEKTQLDDFMADQGWVYVRQDDHFTGFVQQRLEGWVLSPAAGLVSVPCPRFAAAGLTSVMLPRPGSVVGLLTRMTGPILAGTLTAVVDVGGVVLPGAPTVVLDAANAQGFMRVGIGAIPYGLWGVLRLLVSTDVGFVETPGSLFEGMIEVVE